MQTPHSLQRPQKTVFAYLAFLFLALVAAGLLLIRTGRNWGFGDWLINYEGGFVRRGLMGQICLQAGRLVHLDPVYIVAIIGIACYAVLFYSVWQLAALSSWSWWVSALLISPVTLAFPVISRTSFRKEILFYAVLASLVLWLKRHDQQSPRDLRLSLVLSLALPVLILSHEPLVAYFPYAAAALLIAIQSRRVAFILAAPILLSGIATAAAITHIGDIEVVRKICASLGDPSLDTCSEAVQTLAQTKQYAAAYTAGFIERYHYLPQYGIAVLLASIPVVAACRDLLRRPGARRAVIILLAAVCCAFPLSIGLFHYGVDWGRWIQMHMMSLCLLVLLIDTLYPSSEPRPAKLKPAMILFLIVYATCWSMPGVKNIPRFGYLSHLERVLHWNGSLTNQ